MLFCIIVWSTTAGFSTITELQIDCPGDNNTYSVEYKVEYPFDAQENKVETPANCSDETYVNTQTFPLDFSCSAMLYVLVCALSMFYALGCAILYSIYSQKYCSNPLIPMVDLSITLLLALVWLVMTCMWALNVSDLKHYTHPSYIKKFVSICEDKVSNCVPAHPGKWSSLNISVVAGFTCVLLWAASLWFVFKETTLHKGQSQVVTTSGVADYRQQPYCQPGPSGLQQQQQQQNLSQQSQAPTMNNQNYAQPQTRPNNQYQSQY